MIEFDPDKTARFFNDVYRRVDFERGKKPEMRLHPRDRILLNRILPAVTPATYRILDYGCGQGRLLATLLDRGFDAEGIEKHAEMRRIAQAETAAWSKDRPRILEGGIDELGRIASGSYDMLIAMGVFQYLPKPEYDRTLAEFRRLLKTSGVLIATFQNALFDLYTFNKYTVDFMMEKVVLPHLEQNLAAQIRQEIAALIVNPGEPPRADTRARDNIFVHLTNPLTIDAHLRDAGFAVKTKYFYEFFGLPPLIAANHDVIAKEIAARFEVDNATAWEGHFMANAFLVHVARS